MPVVRHHVQSPRHPPTQRRRFVLLALAVGCLTWAALLGGCARSGEIRYATDGKADVSPDGLHRIHTWGGRQQRVYVKPGVELQRYDKVMLEPVVVRFSLASARVLDRDDVALVKKTFREVFEQQLAKSAVYTLVTEPGPDVLRVTPQLIDVVVTAPPRAATPDEMRIMESAGAVTLALELSDSRSHTVLVRAYDRRAVGGQTGMAYRDTAGANLAQARILFVQWAQRLRSWLDRVREIPPLPAEAAAEAS